MSEYLNENLSSNISKDEIDALYNYLKNNNYMFVKKEIPEFDMSFLENSMVLDAENFLETFLNNIKGFINRSIIQLKNFFNTDVIDYGNLLEIFISNLPIAIYPKPEDISGILNKYSICFKPNIQSGYRSKSLLQYQTAYETIYDSINIANRTFLYNGTTESTKIPIFKEIVIGLFPESAYTTTFSENRINEAKFLKFAQESTQIFRNEPIKDAIIEASLNGIYITEKDIEKYFKELIEKALILSNKKIDTKTLVETSLSYSFSLFYIKVSNFFSSIKNLFPSEENSIEFQALFKEFETTCKDYISKLPTTEILRLEKFAEIIESEYNYLSNLGNEFYLIENIKKFYILNELKYAIDSVNTPGTTKNLDTINAIKDNLSWLYQKIKSFIIAFSNADTNNEFYCIAIKNGTIKEANP